jgi:hypothetical protein
LFLGAGQRLPCSQGDIVPAEAATGRVIAELTGEVDRIHVRRDALEEEIGEAFLARPFDEILASLPGRE